MHDPAEAMAALVEKWDSEEVGRMLPFAMFMAWAEREEGGPEIDSRAGFVEHMKATFDAKAKRENRSQASIDEQLAEIDEWLKTAKRQYAEKN